MANDLLRHYRHRLTTASVWTATHATVASGRALVVSKLIINNPSSVNQNFSLAITANAVIADEDVSHASIVLAPNESYVETGLVLTTGEVVRIIAATATPLDIRTHVFGVEVDNV